MNELTWTLRGNLVNKEKGYDKMENNLEKDGLFCVIN